MIRDTPVDVIADFHRAALRAALGHHRGGRLGGPRRDRRTGGQDAGDHRAPGGVCSPCAGSPSSPGGEHRAGTELLSPLSRQPGTVCLNSPRRSCHCRTLPPVRSVNPLKHQVDVTAFAVIVLIGGGKTPGHTGRRRTRARLNSFPQVNALVLAALSVLASGLALTSSRRSSPCPRSSRSQCPRPCRILDRRRRGCKRWSRQLVLPVAVPHATPRTGAALEVNARGARRCSRSSSSPSQVPQSTLPRVPHSTSAQTFATQASSSQAAQTFETQFPDSQASSHSQPEPSTNR